MTWPTAFVILGGVITASLAIIKIVTTIWGSEIKKICVDKFAEINDTGDLQRGDCMEKFKRMADTIQANMLQTASLQTDMKTMQSEMSNMAQKIDELKVDFKELTIFIRENLRDHQRK